MALQGVSLSYREINDLFQATKEEVERELAEAREREHQKRVEADRARVAAHRASLAPIRSITKEHRLLAYRIQRRKRNKVARASRKRNRGVSMDTRSYLAVEWKRKLTSWGFRQLWDGTVCRYGSAAGEVLEVGANLVKSGRMD